MTEHNEVRAKQERKTISVRISKTMYDQIGEKSEKMDFINRSEYIRDLIKKDLA